MDSHVTDWKALRTYCRDLIMSLGTAEEDAFIVADSLVDADLCGVESHGVSRMSIYLKRLKTGVVSRDFRFAVLQEHSGSAALDFAAVSAPAQTIFAAGDALSVRPSQAPITFRAQPNPAAVSARVDVFQGVVGWATLSGIPSSPTAATTGLAL